MMTAGARCSGPGRLRPVAVGMMASWFSLPPAQAYRLAPESELDTTTLRRLGVSPFALSQALSAA